MTPTCIALLSGQSLLVEGVASRLQAHVDKVLPEVLHPEEEGLRARLSSLQPEAIIVDARDPAVRGRSTLYELLELLPEATVMMLDSERSELQIVKSRRESITDTEALLEQILRVVQGPA
ncbi:MAG: hypothetical protein R3191_00495 [Anaerolineales bacterium]|nr:hypothetical protein [Anaerolineales bacterium]